MPHAVIDYSASLTATTDIAAVVTAVHGVMAASGLFGVNDIKTRATPAPYFCVGGLGSEGSFVHTTIYLLEGRTAEQKSTLTTAIHQCLTGMLGHVTSVSVDIRDMVKETYRKNSN